MTEHTMNPVAVFEPFRQQLAEIKQKNTDTQFDYNSKAGRKEARSHIYKIRQSRAEVERRRKEEKEPILKAAEALDTIANEIKAEFDQMIEFHLTPVEEAEKREEERLASLRIDIKSITEKADTDGMSAEQIKTCMQQLMATDTSEDVFAELADEAAQAKQDTLEKLRIRLEAQKKHEEQQAELDRLRREAAEREERERKEREIREAEEAKRFEEQRQKEEAAKEAARKQQEEIDRQNRERNEAIRRAEEAERKAKEAEEQRIRDKEEAEAREKAAAERAAQAERDRIANEERIKREAEEAERARVKAAEEKAEQERRQREADAKIRDQVRGQIKAALVEHAGIDKDDAISVTNAIDAGEIPYVTINW